MRRVFVPNFDFERELQGRPVAERVRQHTAGLAWCWRAIASEGDVLLREGEAEAEGDADGPLEVCTSAERLIGSGEPIELVPWGWSSASAALAARLGHSDGVPDLELVQLANRRRWARQREVEAGLSPNGVTLVSDAGELDGAVEQAVPAGVGWVIKADLGMAGREQRWGPGEQLGEEDRRWAAARIADDGVVVVEPWLDCEREIGLQYVVEPDGRSRLLGMTELLSNGGGRGGYLGSRIGEESAWTDDPLWPAVRETTDAAVGWLAEAGYHGPVGIDAMQYRDPAGQVRWRPLQDVNVRFTMGRLALGWCDRLGPSQVATSLQVRWGPVDRVDECLRQVERSVPGVLEVLRTSPLGVGEPTESGLVLIRAETQAAQLEAETQVIEGLQARA